MEDDAFSSEMIFLRAFFCLIFIPPHLLSAVLIHFQGSSWKYDVVSCSDSTLKVARLCLLPSLPASPFQRFITLVDRNLLVLNLNIFMETLYLLSLTYI